MRSKKVEFWMPWNIYEKAVADSEARGYDSLGRYFIGLSLQSILTLARDQTRVRVSNQNPKQQDQICRALEEIMKDPERLLETLEATRR
jgi:hypothetical protein